MKVFGDCRKKGRSFVKKVVIIKVPESELDKINMVESFLENILGHITIVDLEKKRFDKNNTLICGASFFTGHKIEHHVVEESEVKVITSLIKQHFK